MKTKNYPTTNKKNSPFGKVIQFWLVMLTLVFTTTLTAQDVYMAGRDNNNMDTEIAHVWKGDGTEHNLSNGNYRAGATDIFIYEGDEYVAGYESNGLRYVAKLWKNGVAQEFTDGTNFAGASSVFVSDDDVYVAGDEFNGSNYVAKLWKNGVAQILTDGSSEAQAKSVFVSGSDVYVAGYESNSSIFDAKIWKNGTPHTLSDGSNDAIAYSVFVSDDDVYAAGYQDNGTHYVAKLWKNGNVQNLTDGSSTAKANSVFVSDGDVYVAGYEGDDPKLWKNGVEEPLSVNSAFDGAKARSVYVSGTNVYVGGISTVSNGTETCEFGTLWKNGAIEAIYPGPDCNPTGINSVFVDDGQLSTETVENPQNNINLYPNPASGILHLQTKHDIQAVTLYAIIGQQLQTWKNTNNIDLSAYAPGTYFVKINTTNNSTIKQIIKE